jgi:hypothetical protein
MEQSATDGNEESQRPPSEWPRGDAGRAWAVGVPIALAVTALISGASYYARAQSDAKNETCLHKAANDTHAAFEAFFQNPPDGNALAQIERTCAQ